jgi:hypothetical protein
MYDMDRELGNNEKYEGCPEIPWQKFYYHDKIKRSTVFDDY